MSRKNYSSGAPLEESVGYSRMVKVANMVMIGGTTSVLEDGSVYGEGNPYEQANYIFKKHVKLLEQAGAKAADVVKVDVFLIHMSDAKEVGRAYSEFFHDIKPLLTVVGTTELNRPTQLCEIAMTAVIDTEL